MRKQILFIMLGFVIGLFMGSILNSLSLQPANATVAGLNNYDLRNDYDFKKAVRYVVENSCIIVNYGGQLELDCE